ncbi:ABC1 kinase family protein [Myxacorys almedinensis]|uniref:AarF/ABC1/UbiB kinase family protein n=1 Tax=Myxacorys almedinensis A TaxID=2690445 RepID=A0A8J8CKA8_9CYAN|nr:AarF/ABC1/UbiB kinase family protein [Myxacorys almedinensis]NDJ19354.1 AarF/ABC1/UbiB kinase family protein [Myxacorys almedinensis A]
MAIRASLPFVSRRQADIIEVVARNGWSYFRNQLSLNPEPEQFSLPLPEVLRQILIDLGPTFVKLGQLLSTRPDLLAPEYIQALETLQDDVPALPWVEIEDILKAEFQQPWTTLFAEIDQSAIAAGSLGQVHKGRLKDGQVVAIKIQRPGIRSVIEQDLDVLQSLAEWFSSDSVGQAYDLPGLVEEFRSSLNGELDFRREARNTDQLRENLSSSTLWNRGQVIVPQVFWSLTRERVLVLEWIEGVKLNSVDLPEARKQALAALIVQVIMQQMLLNRFFHADPHPGNFLYIGDETENRIALLDCGMVAMFDPRTQRIISDLLVGIIYEQPRQVAQSIRELGFTRLELDLRSIESAFDRLLRRFYTRPLEEINMTELLNEALRIPRENKIQMPGTIGLFVKAIANVEGIARRFDPLFPFVDVARPVVEQSLQRRMFGDQIVPDIARSSLYLSEFLIQFPQRLDVLLDRLERSELGLIWRWRDQSEFQQAVTKAVRRISLALIGVGSMVSGSLLATAGLADPSGATLLWSQGLLGVGITLGAWLVMEYLFKP